MRRLRTKSEKHAKTLTTICILLHVPRLLGPTWPPPLNTNHLTDLVKCLRVTLARTRLGGVTPSQNQMLPIMSIMAARQAAVSRCGLSN